MGGNPSDGIREEGNCESCHSSFAPRPHPHPVLIAPISLLMTAYQKYAITEGKAWYISHMTDAKNGKGFRPVVSLVQREIRSHLKPQGASTPRLPSS